jgi:hypothetical protein
MRVKNNDMLHNQSISSLSKDILRTTASNISGNCKSWLNQYAYYVPQEVFNRRKHMRGLRCMVKTIIGMLVKPHLPTKKNIYIFQGLRNKVYMAAFSPDSVVIVGSHLEKKYADTHGYSFCWSFPIRSAIDSKMIRDWNYPAMRQLKFWTKKLSRYSNAIFFLQEDTQSEGTFFVYVGRLLPSTVSSVCIQHGYFLENIQFRLDGTLSDFNFVMDQRQSELIGANRLTTFVIGLPYIATASPPELLNVILVGTGNATDGPDYYQRCINTYTNIHNMLANVIGVKVSYRPHPNEYNDEKLIAELTNSFSLVESRDKLEQLNGPRAIFIGTISTLLYEAKVAGHFVAHFKFESYLSDMTPIFDYDFEFDENQMSELLQWILSIKNNNILEQESSIDNKLDPLQRFNLALREAELID